MIDSPKLTTPRNYRLPKKQLFQIIVSSKVHVFENFGFSSGQIFRVQNFRLPDTINIHLKVLVAVGDAESIMAASESVPFVVFCSQ